VDILLVEDDITLSRALSDVLAHRGFKVSCCGDGIEAVALARRHEFDVILLDLTLPGIDGLEVLQHLRSGGAPTPVVVITARDSVDDKARALATGADDYITKPFDVVELEARLRTLVRRYRGDDELRCGTLRFDPRAGIVADGSRPLDLSWPERALLELLMRRRGQAVPKEMLCQAVLGTGAATSVEAVEPLVEGLRERIAGTATALMALRGVGYLLMDEAVPAKDD
jgi:DNA-binding response OmpR family regulator